MAQFYVNLLMKRKKKNLRGNDDTASRIESDTISNFLDEELTVEALPSLGSDQSQSEKMWSRTEFRKLTMWKIVV